MEAQNRRCKTAAKLEMIIPYAPRRYGAGCRLVFTFGFEEYGVPPKSLQQFIPYVSTTVFALLTC